METINPITKRKEIRPEFLRLMEIPKTLRMPGRALTNPKPHLLDVSRPKLVENPLGCAAQCQVGARADPNPTITPIT